MAVIFTGWGTGTPRTKGRSSWGDSATLSPWADSVPFQTLAEWPAQEKLSGVQWGQQAQQVPELSDCSWGGRQPS